MVNDIRTRHELSRLRDDPVLATAARAHSADMARRHFFDHVDPDGTTPFDRMRAYGDSAPGGENIAVGQRSSSEVVLAWMNSPGHRRNILDPRFTRIGVGTHSAPDGVRWTQNFGF
ncbi:CAP domain-containing protein [Streptomyces sp. TLI_171]|uniref:CAP domain-containing protein n=1 Tax=Streptomyces sp. TLI_171 TaxID=1938859 RepID=UPI000C176BAB|nr:CAP domain-containing protein [Streptomyces sp. TLI_171]